MTEQLFTNFAIPRRVAADVVPLHAFEAAMGVVQGLMAECQNLATALAEAKPDSADAFACYLGKVLDGTRAALDGWCCCYAVKGEA